MLVVILTVFASASSALAQGEVFVEDQAAQPAAQPATPQGYGQPAQPPPPPPPQQQQVYAQPAYAAQPAMLQPERDHRGFFMRFNLSANFMGMRTDLFGDDLTIRGGGAGAGISIGGSIISRLAIHFDLYTVAAISPSVEIGGASADADSLVLVVLGGGGTFYLPNNMFFTVGIGVGAASLSTDAGSSVGSTDAGVAARFQVGKEWWLGSEWGIGLAATFGYARLPDGPTDWNTGHVGIGLSLTKN
ncbi:MAG: hypothetical protein AAGE52_36595 [Myxococcota bacterium]